MGKSKAPEYATTTTSTGGLFGESTSSGTGTSFKAEDWQNTMGGTGSNLINQSLAGLSSNDYSQDPNFQVYQDNFNRGMQQAYDTNVLGNLTNRGLMRSSGLQAATNSFNNTMQEGLADLYDTYYNRQMNNLNAGLNAQNQLYNWITGLNNSAMQNSQAVSDYNMQAYQAEQAAKQAMFDSIMGAVGQIGGAAMTGGASLGVQALKNKAGGGAA
jgi:hypothetical protein